jgi:hypothetical protein
VTGALDPGEPKTDPLPAAELQQFDAAVSAVAKWRAALGETQFQALESRVQEAFGDLHAEYEKSRDAHGLTPKEEEHKQALQKASSSSDDSDPAFHIVDVYGLQMLAAGTDAVRTLGIKDFTEEFLRRMRKVLGLDDGCVAQVSPGVAFARGVSWTEIPEDLEQSRTKPG